jgi:hypothetical protein
MAAEAKLLPWSETNGVASTNTLRIQGPKDHQSMGLPDVLAGEYAYDLWWELTGHTKPTAQGQKLCSLDTEVSAYLRATFTAPQQQERMDLEPNPLGFRIATHQVVDGSLDVYLQRKGYAYGAEGQLVLFDQLVVPYFADRSPYGGSHTDSSPLLQRTEKLYEYQDTTDVFGIPVYVYIHIDGTAGFEYSVTATPPPANACAVTGVIDDHNLAGALTLTLTPYGNIHAGASAGVGIQDILSVGVQADLDVITARLPVSQTLSVAVNPAAPTNPQVEVNFNAHLDADIMAGSISVYAEALTERADKQIVSWPGAKWTEDHNKTFAIPLNMFNTQFK